MGYLPWTLPDPLNGTAKILATYISEIQHNVNHLQETAGFGVTEFSPAVGSETKFLKNLVEELKTAVENPNLLGYYGYSSITDILGHPWSAYPKSVVDKIDCWGYKILNDLRLFLNKMGAGSGELYVVDTATSIVGISVELVESIQSSIGIAVDDIVSDGSYFYTSKGVSGKTTKFDKNSLISLAENTTYYSDVITSDGNKIFVCTRRGVLETIIYVLNASTLNYETESANFYIPHEGWGSSVGKMSQVNDIICDKNYIYLIGKVEINGSGPARGKIMRVNKSTLIFFDEITYTEGANDSVRFMSVAIDKNNIYVATDYITSLGNRYIRKYTRNLGFLSTVTYYSGSNIVFWGLIIYGSSLYAVGISLGGDKRITKYKTSDLSFEKELNVDSYSVGNPASITNHDWYFMNS